jgi:S1-C subfamily serine protease
MRINDAAVGNLQEYSNVLRGFLPGQRVTVVLRRGSEDVTLEVTLAER